ncbi:sensor histidine kinase [Pengzhenrongella frigida]|uniref:histidine kinase n=1 Tax=Pengzhenrongella frigida TaxID=1259133 RepID=A0A4Q5MVW8_9MICO|nr:HAMP domain-containing sensor histidine kinase [Cellulomonas sp. HLT2-17]RYV49690.1 HAMP domain-containing histidine kinase [Cellulomonas sp. HLT2-17]
MRARQPGQRRAPLSFAWRLMVSLGLVVLAGAVTVLGVALGVAPQIFGSHLRTAPGAPLEERVSAQVEGAFANAIVLSLGVAIPVGMLVAFAVSWLVAQRLGRSVAAVAVAADRIARGNLQARVEAPAIGPEFAQLADAFNSMAGRLAETESTRRRLIGDLAHELRTPLASLEATVEAVIDGVLPADVVTLDTLVDQTARLQHLVADMAAVSRAEERQLDLRPRVVEVASLASDAVLAATARFVAAGVRLELDIVGEPSKVRVDPQRIAEVLANLLDNALRHTPAGREVRVVVGPQRDTADDGVAMLKVTDTGGGFDPSDAERIFERFYRTDSSRTRTTAGTGIGLTIARAIVEAHDGTLTATSGGPGAGATFLIRLPRHPPARSDDRRAGLARRS